MHTGKGAVLIPNQATQISQQGPFVYVVKPDDTAELRPVTLGQRQGDDVVVDQGTGGRRERGGHRPADRAVPARKVRVAPRPGGPGTTARAGRAGGGKVVNLSEPFIRRPVMTVVLTVSAILFGVLAYFNCR